MHKLNLRNISISITILFLILFFIFLTLGTLSEKTPKINRGVNSTMGEVIISAPEGTQFELKNLNGENINLEDYKGIPVVIDFWSSWCGPCIKEASVLSDGYKEWNFKGVEFIGIAIWDDKNSIENFIKNTDGRTLSIR